jgi:hypothetical protein
MSDERKSYALKGLTIMGCMFVSSFNETLKTYGTYDIEKHDQIYLKKFKDFGYAGSRMDDFLPFYEMWSNTIQAGIPMRKLLEQKAEHVEKSQLGFQDFVDDKIMQAVPVAKLDDYIANNCNGDLLDKVLVDPTKSNPANKVPWYKNIYIWIAVVTCIFLAVGVVMFFIIKKQIISTNAVSGGKRGNKVR